MKRRIGWPGVLVALTLLGALAACASLVATDPRGAVPVRFRNLYEVAEDKGDRVSVTYFLHRAWVQITRDLARTEVPPTVPLDLRAMARHAFAVSWLGHSSLLLQAGSKWLLIDPVFSATAGPVAGFGPARLAPLPLALEDLPHIDIVLISHDHYDHLDEVTVQRLAAQPGGAPRFFVGKGLRRWFEQQVRSEAEEFDWWQSREVDGLKLSFVPAQHNSNRSLWNRNTTLWGGWGVEHDGRRFYFPGDTAYVAELFRDIRARVGLVHLAAMPIGAYQPRALMRYEHMNPDDAVQAHLDLGAVASFGVHWGTFQLGDEEPFEAARDLDVSLRRRGVANFALFKIGSIVDVPGPALATLAN